MRNRRIILPMSFCCLLSSPVLAQTISGGTCSASTLKGTYSLNLTGRAITSTGAFNGSYQGNGTATFDGQSNVTFSGTDNTNLATGKSFTYSGTYAVPSNCYGTITLTTGSSATFTLVVWSTGQQFNIVGADSTYIYSGAGNNLQPALCATSTLSGEFIYYASGFTVSGTTQNGAGDESGVYQFDGQGNVTASYSVFSVGTTPATALTATGSYSVTSGCLATATLTDSTGKANTLNFVVNGLNGNALDVLEANSQFVRTGPVHAVFFNPSESISNAASGVINATPPGSLFSIYGVGLATRQLQEVGLPIPTTLLTTSVTVNGEAAPLFFVDTDQINAQMPWDIPSGAVATVIVKNGTATSNPAAVFVPATGTPGIILINNRAAVTNQDNSLNTGANGAKVGDEVVAYFLGGGPVQASGPLVTGRASPAGLSPVTGQATVTVGGVQTAVPFYVGLTPGSVGLYQANFQVPQLAKGTYPVVITIAGQASNAAVMTVTN